MTCRADDGNSSSAKFLMDRIAQNCRNDITNKWRKKDEWDNCVAFLIVPFQLYIFNNSHISMKSPLTGRFPPILGIKVVQTEDIIAPYAASFAPITKAHQHVAVSRHTMAFDSFHLGATLKAWDGGVSSTENLELAMLRTSSTSIFWPCPGTGGSDELWAGVNVIVAMFTNMASWPISRIWIMSDWQSGGRDRHFGYSISAWLERLL